MAPTASHAATGHQRPIEHTTLAASNSANADVSGDPHPTNYSRPRPGPRPSHLPPPSTPPAIATAHSPRDQSWQNWQPKHARFPSQGSYLQELQQQSPFRVRADSASTQHSHHHRSLSASRLWNPANSTRSFLLQPPPPLQPRRPSTPDTPPPIPIPRLTLDDVSSVNLAGAVAQAGDASLLTPSEQRGRTSPQIDQAGRDSVSLPRSIRHSYDEIRSRSTVTPSPSTETEAGPSSARPQPAQKVESSRSRGPAGQAPYGERTRPDATGTESGAKGSPKYAGKGKGKAAMAIADDAEQQAGASFDRDVEQGPEPHRRDSMGSLDDGIGSAISSSNSSIMGDPDGQADDEEWGPQHPCFPHLNPHVPLDSPEYVNTRIIRIKRDWLLEGDLAPTFSNMYPEILDPAGLSEVEFRRVIDKLNSELIAIFNPYSLRNILDSVMGLLTGWIWDDIGLTNAKARLARLERWIERWNKEMEKTIGGDDNVTPPKIVPLRQTAYMTVSILPLP